MDIAFIIDIFINFLSSYEKDDGKIVQNFKKIAINYLTGFFWIDFIASFPMDLVMK